MSYFAPYIDGSGIHMPTYEDRLIELFDNYELIFGVVLQEDDPDMQLLKLIAQKLMDVSDLIKKVYASRDVAVASGASLDVMLPTFGLKRQVDEDDQSLRNRIKYSLPGRGAGLADAILAQVSKAQYVRMARVYENTTDSTDADGLPSHSVAVVTYAGNNSAIAQAIYKTKPLGITAYGSTTVNIEDSQGLIHSISFSKSTTRRIFAYISIRRLPGIDEDAVTAAITDAVNSYINDELGIGEALIIPRLYSIAYQADPSLATTFAIADIYANLQGEATYTRDQITCPWNAKISILTSGGLTITYHD